MYRHVNPDRAKASFAPYNFIPLPSKVFFAPEESILASKSHDRFLADTLSGFIELELETLTPMFIRGPVRMRSGKWDDRATRLRPEPFLDLQGHPVIPGSSLRGAIRNLYEIITFSRLAPVTDEHPFYRSVGTDRLGQAYRNRMVRANTKPRGGFLRRQSDGSWAIAISPAVKRVPHEILTRVFDTHFKYDFHPRYRPDPDNKIQEREVWVRVIAEADSISDLLPESQNSPGNDWQRAVLLLTGGAPPRNVRGEKRGKEAEFAFLLPAQPETLIPIPELLWKRFHDEDQLTQYQEQVFKKSVPPAGDRPRDGYLYSGEPVFFVCDENHRPADNPMGLVFFGRASMFRLPYDKSPLDLLPEDHRQETLDLTEAVFGMVRTRKNRATKAVKSRLRFEDCVATTTTLESVHVPQTLLGPKITTFQHYLTQNGNLDSTQLTTYLQGDKTTIRGHKLYWHRHIELEDAIDPQEAELLKNQGAKLSQPGYSTRTVIQPVPHRTIFRGRIRFENLHKFELGALLACLYLREGCAHKIGMGKPLGLGTVQIRPTLKLIDRDSRYNSWSETGVHDSEPAPYIADFESRILSHADATNETVIAHGEGLERIARLNALFSMLDWESSAPTLEQARYMSLDEFRDRDVLPSPFAVIGAAEPDWAGDLPEAAPIEKDETGQFPRQVAKQPAKHLVETSAPYRSQHAQPSAARGLERTRCVVLDEKTGRGGWRFQDKATGRKGHLHPTSSSPPSDLKAGMECDMVVASKPADPKADLVLKFPVEPSNTPGGSRK